MKCYVTFSFLTFSVVETLVEWLHEAWDVHSCLFHVRTSSKVKGMIVLTRPLHRRINWCVCTAIFHDTSKSITFDFPQKMTIWQMRLCFLSKETIYKTGRFFIIFIMYSYNCKKIFSVFFLILVTFLLILLYVFVWFVCLFMHVCT